MFLYMKKTLNLISLSLLLLLIGCNQSDNLTIQGHIDNASGDTLLIKRLVNNQMTILDSKVIKGNGAFKFKLPVEEFPPYYFLQIKNGTRLVVMRDSVNTINVEAASSNFKDAVITGSPVSVRLNTMLSDVMILRKHYAEYFKDLKTLDADEQNEAKDVLVNEINEVKAKIEKEIFSDPSSYYAYYALYQRLSQETVLFTPYDESDYKYFAAVATSYDLYHKEDPRNKALYDMVSGVLAAKRSAKLKEMVDAAPSVLPDIVMNDLKGNERKLSNLKGKIVILNFWASKSEDSRLWNREFKQLYSKYKSKGLTVFQVSADKSKLLWEDAIINDELPWINVCDFKEGASKAFSTYNVRHVPTTYLVDRNGQMIGKYESPKALEDAIKKAL